MKLYTKQGDDGTTGLLYGGRVPQDDPRPEAYGTLDAVVAALGVARAGGLVRRVEAVVVRPQREMFVAGAELATARENRHKLSPGATLVTEEMVAALEPIIDDLRERFPMPSDFVIPGGTRCGAALDLARSIVRRAERDSLEVAVGGSHVVAYLNRLSDLLWAMARWQEHDADTLLAKEI